MSKRSPEHLVEDIRESIDKIDRYYEDYFNSSFDSIIKTKIIARLIIALKASQTK